MLEMRKLILMTIFPRTMITLKSAVDEFLEAGSLKFSPHTVRDYTLTLGRAVRHFANNPLLCDLQARDMTGFLSRAIPGSNKNRLNAYIALSSLFTWALKNNYVERHIMRLVEKPRATRKEIIPFSETEVKAMLREAGRMEMRNRALMLFMLDNGAREAEVCDIRLADIHDGMVKVLGKGARERMLPVSARTWRVILEYLDQSQGQRERYLFVTEAGKKIKPDRLYKLIHRIGERAGVERAYPHRFRHTFAVNYLLNEGDPFSLQRILGHSTMEMVNRYLALVREDIQKIHKKASPVTNWNL